jgi:imidazolonepropionase-like amidohydrolase
VHILAAAIAIVGVNVIPMDERVVLRNQTVIIRGDTIEAVGPARSVRTPRGARRIDGKGLYLLPGLADMHVHLRDPGELETYLRYGITTIVHTGGAEPNAPDLLRYRDELESGKRVGPSLFVSGPLIDGPQPIFRKLAVAVSTPEDARNVAAEQKKAGYDFHKTYNFLPRDAYLELLRVAQLPVIGHVPEEADIFTAIASGHAMFLHASDFVTGTAMFDRSKRDITRIEAEIARAVEAAAKANVVVTPTLVASRASVRKIDAREEILADPETQTLAPSVLAMWRQDTYVQRLSRKIYPIAREITKALHDRGVMLMTGTDAAVVGVFPGRGLHDELRELVSMGLTPYDALRAATVNPGSFLRKHVPRAKPFGVVRPGYRADLLLVKANPLDDVANAARIEGVIVRGRWYPGSR